LSSFTDLGWTVVLEPQPFFPRWVKEPHLALPGGRGSAPEFVKSGKGVPEEVSTAGVR